MSATAKVGTNGTNGVHKNRVADLSEKASNEVVVPKIVIPKPEIRMFTVGIVGTSPLITHKWSEKAKRQMLDKQMKKAKVAKEAKNPEEDYNQARYISTEGWDGVTAVSFKAALVGACRQCDGIPMTVAKRTFFVEPEGYTDDGNGLIRIHGEPRMREDMVRLETGTADIRFRPMYMPWRAQVTIRFNANVISEEQVINLLSLAGMSEGVGEWRPSAPKSHTGTFGCWTIEE